MFWVNLILKYTAWIPAILFSVENWRIWYWNRYARGNEKPMPYYPVVGGLFFFLAFSLNLPADYGYWAYLALILDYGCLPLGLQTVLCYLHRRQK